MNGAETLLATAADAGITLCLMNPGTTEMPLVSAFETEPRIRPVLVVQEGVATGAADGYYRMSGKPAMVLLHLGPGLANGAAYLHDAKRSGSGVLTVIGEHASWHLPNDPPLAMDIAAVAGSVSARVATIGDAAAVARDTHEATAVANAGQIATLIVPHDFQLGRVPQSATPSAPPAEPAVRIEAALAILRAPGAAILLGGTALSERGIRAAGRLSAAGVRLLVQDFPARLERGGGLIAPERVPYFPEDVIRCLAKSAGFVCAGAREPVAFFGYPNIPGRLLPPGAPIVHLFDRGADAAVALDALADAIGAPAAAAVNLPPPTGASGPLDQATFGKALAAAIPENAIVMDEGNTSSPAFYGESSGAPRHSYMTQPGGAIGLGLPAALGAALACPDRPVIAIQADGSALYTLQALWTMAREHANVTVILCDNRSYRILGLELARTGKTAAAFGPVERAMIDLGTPPIDWLALAKGFGVDGVGVSTAEDLTARIAIAVREPGPFMIVAAIV